MWSVLNIGLQRILPTIYSIERTALPSDLQFGVSSGDSDIPISIDSTMTREQKNQESLAEILRFVCSSCVSIHIVTLNARYPHNPVSPQKTIIMASNESRILFALGEEMMDSSPKPKTPVADGNSSSSSSTAVSTTETDEERRRREEEESVELARQLMAEEAMASYENSFQLLRASADHLTPEDYEAMQAAMREDEREEVEELEDDEGELSYDTMLTIGERIGDVKQERWTMVARQHIDKLPVETFTAQSGANGQCQQHANDSEHKCLVCQHEYEDQEKLRRLPCRHVFHTDCVDQWLMTHDDCPYCRDCIVTTKND